ncbi:hypothetical protein [Microbacterium aureliae]
MIRQRRLAVLLALVVMLAFALRFMPYLDPSDLSARREYDDGVMFSAALSVLAGRLPYVDFVYLHPPGSFLWVLPTAALGPVVGEPSAFAAARVVAILTGAANTALIGLLLRRFGATAAVVGALLYALWPAAVTTEGVFLLEPVLSLLLLTALWCIARRSLGLVWVAGAALGLALTVKYWAILDCAVVATVVGARFGAAGLWRFAAAAGGVAGGLAIPFFVRAPELMWHQTVLTQLRRPSNGVSLDERVNALSLFATVPWLDRLLPWTVWAAVLTALIILAVLPFARGLVARLPLDRLPEEAWFTSVFKAAGVSGGVTLWNRTPD